LSINNNPISGAVADILSLKDLHTIWLEMLIRVPKFSVSGEFPLYLVRHRRHPKGTPLDENGFAVGDDKKKGTEGTQSHKTLYFSYLWGGHT